MSKKYKLDAYEQDIEDNLEKHIDAKNKIKFIKKVARRHVKKHHELREPSDEGYARTST